MNIHSVIYDAVFKDIHIMDSELFIEKQFGCLMKCLDFYTDINSFEVNNKCPRKLCSILTNKIYVIFSGII